MEGQRSLRTTVSALLEELPASGPMVLELGCGHGHFLTEFARRHPGSQFFGVDFCRDRIRRAERKQVRAGLPNLRFLRAEVQQFLEALPAKTRFNQTLVLFPDPWPKRRHRKNRMVTPDLLARLAEVSAPGARFSFRSDAADYVADVRTAIGKQALWRALSEDLLPLEFETVFQQRAQSYGTVIAELVS